MRKEIRSKSIPSICQVLPDKFTKTSVGVSCVDVCVSCGVTGIAALSRVRFTHKGEFFNDTPGSHAAGTVETAGAMSNVNKSPEIYDLDPREGVWSASEEVKGDVPVEDELLLTTAFG